MKKQGFSLIETNLAIFLVAIGLLSIFALFPLGLQQSELAVQDSQEAMFADYVLSALQANAFAITNWHVWALDNSMLKEELQRGLRDISLVTTSLDPLKMEVNDDEYRFPEDAPRHLTYILEVGHKYVNDATLMSAKLQVASGRKQDLSLGRTYYSEFMFQGHLVEE